MKKNTAILLTAFIIFFLYAEFLVFYEFTTPIQQMTTVAEITNDPTAWVNKTVTVEGNLRNWFLIQSWESSQANWSLTNGNQTIGVALNTNLFENSEYALRQISQNGYVPVKIYGAVRIGDIFMNYPGVSIPPLVIYYIQAQKITLTNTVSLQ